MASIHVDTENASWTSGVPFYGPAAVYRGEDIVQLKVLSDRRKDGGGIGWLVKFLPPPGKLIKIFNLEGGRATKSGQPVRSSGRYTLNPQGQPHSAFIGAETVSLVIYRGEPDEIVSMEVVDAQPTSEIA
jgi:hypothetical protein